MRGRATPGPRRRRARGRPRRASRASSAATPSAWLGPASRDVEHAGEPVAEVGGRAVDEPVDRLHAELVVGELDDEGHDRRRAVVVRPDVRRGRSTRSRSGGGRRRGRPGPSATAAPMAAITAASVIGATARGATPSSSVARRQRRRAERQERGEPVGQREAPDRVEVGARGAEQREPVAPAPWAACARGGGSSSDGSVPTGGSASAPSTPIGAAVPTRPSAGERHPVAVEGGRRRRRAGRRRPARSPAAAPRPRSGRARPRAAGGSAAPSCGDRAAASAARSSSSMTS